MQVFLDRLDPIYTNIVNIIHSKARKRKDVRKFLLEFGKIDGAISSYRGLLLAFDIEDDDDAMDY